MHRCRYEQSFAVIDGKLTHCVVATWKGYRLEVYQRNEEGIKTRNFYFNYMSGYGVEFPGEKSCGSVVKLEKWDEPWSSNINPYFGNDMPTDADKEKVCSLYPDFRYVFKKCDLGFSDIMRVIPIWKENHAVELLLANGWRRLAFNKSFYKMKAEKRKRLLMVLRDMQGENPTLDELRKVAEGWTLDQTRLAKSGIFRSLGLCLDQIRYLERMGRDIDVREYSDYVRMSKKAGHDLRDPYWGCPSDLNKRHQKVIREVKRIQKIEDDRKAKEKQEAYEKAVNKLFGHKDLLGDIEVYIPETCKDIQHHADKLHQCLVTADYIGKVAKGECILVFLKEKGKPLATAELKPKGRKYVLGQFYGDEKKKDYIAPHRAKVALEEWARKFKVKFVA